MKKIVKAIAILLVISVSLICLTGCTSDIMTSSNTEENKTAETPVIKVGETWTVEGQWRLTINSVERTSKRNEFWDKNPQDVVYVTYTYENLGYEDDDGLMDGLYMNLEFGQIVDCQGEMGESYPNSVEKYPQQTPVGAKCVNAQVCIGLNNKGDSFKINFSQYDGTGKNHKVVFDLDIN